MPGTVSMQGIELTLLAALGIIIPVVVSLWIYYRGRRDAERRNLDELRILVERAIRIVKDAEVLNQGREGPKTRQEIIREMDEVSSESAGRLQSISVKKDAALGPDLTEFFSRCQSQAATSFAGPRDEYFQLIRLGQHLRERIEKLARTAASNS